MAGEAFAAGASTGNPYAMAAGAVIDMLSGESVTTSMGMGTAKLNFDTSGTVIGEGDAKGGTLSDTVQKAAALPWYIWAVGALAAIAIIKKVV